MADLTRDNLVSRFGVVPIVNSYPVAASTYLYAGNYVALNASGYLIQTSLTASPAYAIVGVVSKDVDNSSGAAGDLFADVENIYFLDNDATNPITAAHIGRAYCYIVDNHTVSSADLGYRPLAGVPVALGSTANQTYGKVAVACGVATPYASNPYLAASSGAFEARGVATNLAALTFAADGTFEAQGLFPTKSGTWSNHDWSLFLSDTGLAEPRIITINGRFCIAPFYAGVDADMGLILKKESD